MKRQRDKSLWIEEVKDLKAKMENVAGKEISFDALSNAIKIMNDERMDFQQSNTLMKLQIPKK